MSQLVVMGSGETAPTMVRVHRELFASCPAGPAVMLDTPFAFQTNRAELVARIRSYFSDSVGRQVDLAPWSATEDAVQREKSLALVDRAAWVFAGPGSPTYALAQWRDTGIPGALNDVVRRGGTVVLGSAAALALGSHAIPVYEIYKVGADPTWAEGLDLLGSLTGIRAAVVPHYDNKEGATHDTRFCYLGEERLVALEDQLPEHVGVLGVDEHTAMLIDVGTRTMSVQGKGVVSVRRRDHTQTFSAGEFLDLAELASLLRGQVPESTGSRRSAPHVQPSESAGDLHPPAESLRAEADQARAAFDNALAQNDVDGCVTAILGLEEALAAWQADTLQGDDTQEARRALRSMVVRLGELATVGADDPAARVGPFVEALLAVREAARANGDFATSDLVRDRLVGAGIQVNDSSEGTTWTLIGGH